MDILQADDIDAVHHACEQLRALTWFNSNTGCVNDRNPSLVPLMPAEEVWCGGHEIALDVWRLLSFDSDQISSAAHHGFEPTDVSIVSLSYPAMAFANMMKACGDTLVTFDVAESGFNSPTSQAGNAPLTIPVRQLFLEAGMLLTPADPQSIAHWYAAVRYVGWLDTTGGDLRVKEQLATESVDTRYRGLFSEEIAIGIMGALLKDRYGAKVITNTSEYHAKAGISHVGSVADFVADGVHPRTRKNVTIIAESKGSIRQKVAKSRKSHAKSQIAETPYRLGGCQQILGIAFASSLRYGNQKQRSFCEVLDPEPSEPRRELDLVDAYRVAYSKAIRFVGFEAAARQIYHGLPALALPDPRRERDLPSDEDPRARESSRRNAYCREVYGAELIRDLGTSGLMIDRHVLDALREGLNRETVESIRGRERRRRDDAPESFVTGLGLGLLSIDRSEDDRRGRGPERWRR